MWPSPTLNKLSMGQNEVTQKVGVLMQKFSDVFSDKVGVFTGKPIDLVLKQDASPKFFRPRSLPFALKEKVEQELSRLVSEKILTPVETSEWATPIVPILKNDGTVRICGDFKVSLNAYLEDDKYPIPLPDELFTKLCNGKKFSKIDLHSAYNQMLLGSDSKKLVTISTHLGLFSYDRAPYGIKSLPSKFQRIMENILAGIPNTLVFQDDILITGEDNTKHLQNLEKVLAVLQRAGLTVRKEKCHFFQDSVTYLGFVVDKEGLHTTSEKVKAIKQAPVPRDLTQLRAFMGLVNYYGRFCPGLSTTARPLYDLLRKGVKFDINEKCMKALAAIKGLISKAPVLIHFNPDLPLKLYCDSSAYGLGAILVHKLPNGTERPIAFTSRTLSKPEQAYSQIHKEALSLVFGVKKFHQYVYLNKFTLVTDHKPLVSIFGSKGGLPTMTANRLQRYALFLANYQYDIKFVDGRANICADFLSPLPLPGSEDSSTCESGTEVQFNFVASGNLPLDYKRIKKATERDPIISKVVQLTKLGWPISSSELSENIKPFYQKKEQLSFESDGGFWGYRLVIPSTCQFSVLQTLHEGHLSMVKMKSLARSYVWWPNMDKFIEEMVADCKSCQAERYSPPEVKETQWNRANVVWERLHLDFLGPFHGKLYLVCTDSFSKWTEVLPVSSTSAESTINALLPIFSRFGLPIHIVADNGPPFSSQTFQFFLNEYGVKLTFIPPYHPQSNGLAENSVKYFKHKLKTIMHDQNFNINTAMFRILFQYRNSVHCTTKETPAMKMFGRKLRTKLDLLLPISESVVCKLPITKERKFQIGDRVLARNYRIGNTWMPAVIVQKLSPVTYYVRVDSTGVVWKRHIDQLYNKGEKCPFGVGEIEGENEEIDTEYKQLVIPFPTETVEHSPDIGIPTGTVEHSLSNDLRSVVHPESTVQTQDLEIDPGSNKGTEIEVAPQQISAARRYPPRDRKTPKI